MVNRPSVVIDTEDEDISDYYNNADKGWKYQQLLETVIYEYKVNESVIGYVTCSMNKIYVKIDNLDISSHPALLLGRMGLDKLFKKKGIGQDLIDHTVNLALELKEKIGCKFVILEVDKIRSNLIRFYEDYGFEKAEYHPKKPLYLMYFDLMVD